jgi:hypothetical protein
MDCLRQHAGRDVDMTNSKTRSAPHGSLIETLPQTITQLVEGQKDLGISKTNHLGRVEIAWNLPKDDA